MPVRIMCTISFSSADESAAGSYIGSLDDHYKRVVRAGGPGEGKVVSYEERCDESEVCDEEEEDVVELDDLATFFGGCSLHGANHIFVEGKKFSIRQGVWALAFLLAVSLFLVQVVDRVIYYLQYDHITMLDEREAKEMIFPAITFCNYNTFRRSQISYSDLLFMGQLLGYEDSMAPGIPLAPEPERKGARFSVDEFFNRTRHRIEDMLLDCKFRGEDCGTENFQEVRECLNYSMCITK